MKINFLATERHFADHLFPIWRKMGPQDRGRFFLPRTLDAHAYAYGMQDAAQFWKDSSALKTELRNGSRGVLVVAASGNIKFGNHTGNPVILTQHGAGQSYGSKMNASYAGYPGHRGVIGFLHPGEHPAGRDRRVYPNVPVYVVGCPKLDPWHDGTLKLPKNDKPIFCISFHWAAKISTPEASTQFDFYASVLKDLAKSKEFELIGHSHPRIWKRARRVYEKAGIEPVKEFDHVLRVADGYAVDNSSTLFEFASTGRPVVVLNGPSYRRSARFGLRFWDAAHVGINVDDPAKLHEAIVLALEDPPGVRSNRVKALSIVYGYQDGNCSERAARRIIDIAHKASRQRATRKIMAQVNEPKTVYMRALATFKNPREEGLVKRGSYFWTTSRRAKELASPTLNLAQVAEPPDLKSGTGDKDPGAKDPAKTKPAGPTKTKPAGPTKTKPAAPFVQERIDEETEPPEELSPTDEEVEAAMRERLSFSDPKSGGWIDVAIDGRVIHKSRGKDKAIEEGRSLIRGILNEERSEA